MLAYGVQVRGRKTSKVSDLLPPEALDEMIHLLEGGASIEDASIVTGVGPRTVYEWKRRGEDGEEPFDEIATRIAIAQARKRIGYHEVMAQLAPHDYRAIAWLLADEDRKQARRLKELEIEERELAVASRRERSKGERW